MPASESAPERGPLLAIEGVVKRAIVEGRMSAGVAQLPFEMERRRVEAALALIDGRTVEPRIDTGTELVTSANAAGYEK